MFNGVAIRHPPKDGRWGFNLSEIKQKLPKGTVDPEYAPVAHEVEKKLHRLSVQLYSIKVLNANILP